MDKKIVEHFKIADPLLYSTILKIGRIEKIKAERPENYFLKLCREIIGQQLSGRAAETIFSRFLKLYKNNLSPQKVLKTSQEKLRNVGLSNAKAKYIQNLAQSVIDGKLELDKLDKLPDEKVKEELLNVKGIGPWTAEMFLIFTLGRLNVFSHGDLGLRKAIKNIYGFKKDPKVRTVERIVSKWSPYKSYASLVLWQSLEV